MKLVSYSKLALALSLLALPLAANPDALESSFQEAMALREKHDYEGAMAIYDRILGADANNARAHQERGAVFASQGRYGDALTEEKKALAMDPGLHLPHIYTGMIYCNKGRFLDAYTEFNKAKEIKPEGYIVHMRLGVVCRRLKRLDEAATAYEAAAKLKPERSAPHRALSALNIERGEINTAIEQARLAIKLEPTAVNYNNLGTIYSIIDKLDEAGELLRKSAYLDPRFEEPLLTLGRILTLKGDYKGAQEAYEKALKINPRDFAAKQALRTLKDKRIKRVIITASRSEWVETGKGKALYHPRLTISVKNSSETDLTNKNLEFKARFENCRTGRVAHARTRVKGAFAPGQSIEVALQSRKTISRYDDAGRPADYQVTVMGYIDTTSPFESQYLLDRLMDNPSE
ncbi:MAG: tetratricopeptide repeat protein [Candidatus Obscuribacterales bacterium]